MQSNGITFSTGRSNFPGCCLSPDEEPRFQDPPVSPRHHGWLPTSPHLSCHSSHSCGLWLSCCLWSSQTVLPMPHTLPHVKWIASGKLLYKKELNLVLCDDLKWWDGDGLCKGGKDGGNTCILTADSCCCTAESNTAL